MPATPSRCSRSPPLLSASASSRKPTAILRAADHPALHAIPAHAGLRILRARIHLANGRLPDADAAGQAALASAETLGADGYASTAHCVLAVIALRRGDIAAAAGHIAGLPAPMPHFPGLHARTETTLAQAQITEARDGPAAAISHLRQAAAALPAWQGLLAGDPALAAWLVRTSLAAGDQALANQVTAIAVAFAGANPGFPALTAAAAHSQGLATRDAELLAEAAARHPDRWAKASAAEDLAVLLTSTAKDQAIRHLKTALDGYRQTGADRDQARIRRRLRELGVRRRHWTTPATRPLAGWDSLTDTEQAVSRLVAQGLNNNQVAARMYISTHTVAHHLRQAFRKLQIASRVELPASSSRKPRPAHDCHCGPAEAFARNGAGARTQYGRPDLDAAGAAGAGILLQERHSWWDGHSRSRDAARPVGWETYGYHNLRTRGTTAA